MKILVTYASKHGATAEIAQAIGMTLKEQDFTVDVLPIESVNQLMMYDAVIVGSAIYSRKWLPEAAQFLRMRVDILAQKPVWLFSSGPTGQGAAHEMFGGFDFDDELQPFVISIAPQDSMIFHGALKLSKLTLAELQIVKSYGGALGEFRQWDVISQWAEQIGMELAEWVNDSMADV